MLSEDEREQVWAKLEAVGLLDLKLHLKPQEGESGWEIVRIETMEEDHHVSYGFCSRYNGLIVGGLPSLKIAETLKACKMVTSYAEWELERQFY